jgi:glycosyltransferase involved in cell wall biosynthesis
MDCTLKQGEDYFANGDIQSAKEILNESLRIDSRQRDARTLLEDIEQSSIRSSADCSTMKIDKQLNIGFISIWFERGQSYVTRTIRDAIAKEHNTFVFARTGGVYGQPKLETEGYWYVPDLTTYPEYQIPHNVIIKWIQDNDLDAIIFNEEYDWNLVQAAKNTGIKVITYLDYYKKEWEHFMGVYDAVLCSTQRTFNLVKDFCKAYYIGWAVDSDLFRPKDNGDEKFTFFHNAGWLGINYRKMTPAVILAFDAISRKIPGMTLFIHAQAELEKLPMQVVKIVRENKNISYHLETVPAPGLYHKGRILVFPTKLEGLGLPLFEALACGLPVIATDGPPMNEFIKNGHNGLLVRVVHRSIRADNIAFPEELIDINDLALKMAKAASDPQCLEEMAKNSRIFAETKLSLIFMENQLNSLFCKILEHRKKKDKRRTC